MAVRCHAAVHERGNVRMFKRCENLTLATEAANRLVAHRLCAQQLDRDALAELVVVPNRFVDRAHATNADAARDLIDADMLPDPPIDALFDHELQRDRILEAIPGSRMRVEQSAQSVREVGILRVQRMQELVAGRRVQLERVFEQFLQAREALGRHRDVHHHACGAESGGGRGQLQQERPLIDTLAATSTILC